MNDFKRIQFTDFYFNGHFLSDFGGEIGGSNTLSSLSLLPPKELKIEKALGCDEAIVLNATYSPRTFVVPVFFNDLKKIRDIAGWLGVRQPEEFYFKGDDVKINCMIDGEISLDRLFYTGKAELKFIAHDMYYYALQDTSYTFSNPVPKILRFSNKGNTDSFPVIQIDGGGALMIGCNGRELNIEPTGESIILDSRYKTCVGAVSGNDYFYKIKGSYPVLKAGDNFISIENDGRCSKVKIQCNSRWI